MFKKLINVLAILALAAAAGVGGVYYVSQPEQKMRSLDVTQTVNVTASSEAPKATDLSGKWQSEEKAGSKFVGTVKDGKIHIEMVVAEGYTGLWYGTFDYLQPGQKKIMSKAIEDESHFVLSNAKEKEFLYQGKSLIFNFEVMGTRTAIEMKRA